MKQKILDQFVGREMEWSGEVTGNKKGQEAMAFDKG